MKRLVISIILAFMAVLSSTAVVFAENEAPMISASGKLMSDSFTLHVDVRLPEGKLVPSVLRFNLFTEEDEWLGNQFASVDKLGELDFVFPVAKYEIGKKFKVVATTGLTYVNYCDQDYLPENAFLVETYAFRNDDGELIVSDEAHVTVCPLYEGNVSFTPAFSEQSWIAHAENKVNSNRIWSDTDYLIWVSKKNYKVSIYLRENDEWDCIKVVPCSIGAPDSPTIIGQYKYHQYQNKWQYDGYYVGPIMRFYGGYAIHSTLVNNDGTDRDGRVGKMISHGCVRVRPDDIRWLTDYVPIGTKIYITNE